MKWKCIYCDSEFDWEDMDESLTCPVCGSDWVNEVQEVKLDWWDVKEDKYMEEWYLNDN